MTTLDNLRKAARRWLKALRAGDPAAIERFRRAHPAPPDSPGLRDVQHALARERGFDGWTALKASAQASTEGADAPFAELLQAAMRGDVDHLTAVLDRHPELLNRRGQPARPTGLRTPLHFGVHHEPIVRALLERGADPNIRDEGDNAMPLHFAAEHNDLPVIRLLIEHGADPIGTGDGHELEVLGWATVFGGADPAVVDYLLRHGARHNVPSAVATGDVEALRSLAASGADLDVRMDRANQHRRPLHLAVVKRQPEALERLIDLGANLELTDAADLTALDQAALSGETSAAERLLSRGAVLRLPAAIALGRHDDVSRLLKDDPDAVRPGHRWQHLIVRAAVTAPAAIIEALVAAGASVNVRDATETSLDGVSGYTPLHAAAFHGNTAAAKVLLAHGADATVRDSKYRGTATGWADYAGHAETRDVLLEATTDIFDLIVFDRADFVARLVDRDPTVLDRPFREYADLPPASGERHWPDPDTTPLQWAVARKSEASARALIERGAGREPASGRARRERVAGFLEFACWDHHVHGRGDYAMTESAAMRWLRAHPDLAHESFYAAVVCGDLDAVGSALERRPELANQKGGPRGWTPLLYLTYARLPLPAVRENAVAIARALLDHGADPNACYMAGDSPYTPLVGVAGEGEQDAPPHVCRDALYRLLLERGAGPYDTQVLYDTHFRGDVLWWLELTYDHTVKTGRAADWRDPDWPMLDMGPYGSGARFLLNLAIQHRDERLAAWLLERGANPNAAAARDRRFSKRSLYEDAIVHGERRIADLLLAHGAKAVTPSITDEEAFLAASLRMDRHEAAGRLAAHPEYLRSPKALFEAARRDRADVVAMLLDLGVPIEIEDESRQRALHVAAAHDAASVVRLLLERGAEPDPRERRWGGTPISFAAHHDNAAMIDLLAGVSRHVWTLAHRGKLDRLRAVLAAEPARARETTPGGLTPLWWLPNDDDVAAEVADLLMAHGADPAARSNDGTTAADYARQRGLDEAARRIEDAAKASVSATWPDVARYERLARDVRIAHETGDPDTLRRLVEFVGREMTWDELRATLLERLEQITGRKPDTTYLGPNEARLLVARHAGFEDWTALVRRTGNTG